MTSAAGVPAPKYAVISDEPGARLDDCIAFCLEEGLDQIEVRQIDGVAPLSLSDAALRDAAARIRRAGLSVAGIASPLLKWDPPGYASADLGDQFGFDRAGRDDDTLAADTIKVADAFETQNIRIFSYLKHDDVPFDVIAQAIHLFIGHARSAGKSLLLENEPVCNIGRMDELTDAVTKINDPRLRGLPDIGNSLSVGEVPTGETVAKLMPHVDHIHFKDFSAAQNRFVPLGTGDVPLKPYLEQIFAGANGRQLTFSLETHCPDDPLEATRTSIRNLKAAVDSILPSTSVTGA